MLDYPSNSLLKVKHNIELASNANSALEYVFEDLRLNSSIDIDPCLFIIPQFNFVRGGGFVLSYVVK
jgi:hypothetical protein